jgi:hypothetical protein
MMVKYTRIKMVKIKVGRWISQPFRKLNILGIAESTYETSSTKVAT